MTSCSISGEKVVHFEAIVFFGSLAGHLLVLASTPLAILNWRYRLEARWILGLTVWVSLLAVCCTLAGILRRLRGERPQFVDAAAAPMTIGPVVGGILLGFVCAQIVRWRRRRASDR